MNDVLPPLSEIPDPDPRFREMVSSFVERYRRGEVPSVTEYARRNPDLAPLICEFFPGLLLLEELGQGSAQPQRSAPAIGATSIEAQEIGQLGDFHVLREIGRGGMGVVYEAIQASLQRRVALKILPFHSLADKSLLERFRIEAQAAAKLDHPNIVPVFGFGQEDNIHYYAMQYIAGQGLDKVLQEVTRIRGPQGSAGTASTTTPLALRLLSGRFGAIDGHEERPARLESVADGPMHDARSAEYAPNAVGTIPFVGDPTLYHQSVARMGKAVASALAYAHDRRILHRDIKPSNILLDLQGRTWVTDFGLAKEIGEESVTRSGEVVGTLRYMAPERFEGVSDPRSDIYSLGVTLYELLALRPAFQGSDRHKLMKAVIEDEPPPLRAIDRNVPRNLHAIVEAAIRKDPNNRYQNASEIADDLDRFARGMPVAVKSPRLAYRLKRAAKRRAGTIALVAAPAFIALGSLVWLHVAAHRARGPTSAVVCDFDGDGQLDLAVSNVETNNLSLLLHPRTGLTRAKPIRLGDYPYSVTAADFTADGRVDVAACCHRSQELVIVKNTEDGLTRSRTIPLPEPPMRVVAADFDGDSRIDLAVCGGKHCVWILKNIDGDRFSEPTAYEIAENPLSVAAVDLDADGDSDVVVASASPEAISVLVNDGKGTFAPTARRPHAAGFALRLAFADFDGDGAIDMASVNIPVSISVYLNRRDGSFAAPSVSTIDGSVQLLAAGDFDGDGDVDIVAAGGQYDLILLRNEGGGVFAAPEHAQFGDKPSHLLAMDWDRDGALDLLLTNLGSHDVSVLLNDGTGSFREERRLAVSAW